jgi:tRNA(Ile)-lysidine synthetase-like protein
MLPTDDGSDGNSESHESHESNESSEAPIPIVLMVSGGSDSVALMRMMPRLYPQYSYTVLHVNHLLRGEDADEDERFVLDLARACGLPGESLRVDVGFLAAQSGANLEETGRAQRYQAANELLDRLCAQAGVEAGRGRIAVAHTLDDRAETFLMRVIVGGGGSGLSSIPFVNGRVIRPLLDCARKELREWLRADGGVSPLWPRAGDTSLLPEKADGGVSLLWQPTGDASPLWREDASNEDTSRLRAFVRHELIPLARTRNPRLAQSVARSLDVLATEDALLTRLASELEERFVNTRATDTSGAHGATPAVAHTVAYDDTSGTTHDDTRGIAHNDVSDPAHDPAHDNAGAHDDDGAVTVDGALFEEDPALVRRVIRTACKQVMPAAARITFEHIENIAKNGRLIGFATDIPGDVTVRNVYGTLVIRRKTVAEKPKHDPRQRNGRREGAP